MTYAEKHDCQYCGRVFVAYSYDSKYCSTDCEYQAENETRLNMWNYV